MASVVTQTDTQKCCKRLPQSIIELLYVAIFSYACLSGLHITDKVRGDPVVKGVCALFGRLLPCALPQTMEAFRGVAPTWLANWKPGEEVWRNCYSYVLENEGLQDKASPVRALKPHSPRSVSGNS